MKLRKVGKPLDGKNMRKKMCALTANIMKPVENQNDL